jgi:hypothetical protein
MLQNIEVRILQLSGSLSIHSVTRWSNKMAIVWNVQVYRVNPETARPDFYKVLSEREFAVEGEAYPGAAQDEAYGYAAVHNREHFYNYPDTPAGFAFVTGRIDTETGENLPG